jgi:AcrR family transcriptional regulator
MPPVVRPYRGVSAEERRSDRRERLLDAALEEIGDVGLSGLTMKRVCARAGLTERYFYESFGDREALLVALHDRVHAQVDLAIADALGESPAELLPRFRAVAGAVVGVLSDDPRVARTYREAAASDALREPQREATEQYAALLAAQIRESHGLGDRHQARLELVTHVLVSGLIQTIGSWLDGTIALSREDLVDEMARLAVAAADIVRDTA